MKTRVTNSNLPQWKDYGGRGIGMCDRWMRSFTAFVNDVGPCPGPEYSIDRYPNNDGNYEPGNVRWATKIEQARNARNNRLLTYRGKTMCTAEWAEELNISSFLIKDRLRWGWSVAEALSTPVYGKVRKHITHCHKGHEYTPENTFVRTFHKSDKRHGKIHWMCRQCGRDSKLRQKKRNLERDIIA